MLSLTRARRRWPGQISSVIAGPTTCEMLVEAASALGNPGLWHQWTWSLDEPAVKRTHRLRDAVSGNHPRDSKRRGGDAHRSHADFLQRLGTDSHVRVGGVDPRANGAHRTQPIQQPRTPAKLRRQAITHPRLVVQVVSRDDERGTRRSRVVLRHVKLLSGDAAFVEKRQELYRGRLA